MAKARVTAFFRLIKKIRKHYSQVVSRLHAKVVPLNFGNYNSEMAIYSGYSHMLHGNLLLIDDTVTREYSWRNIFLVHGILIHASQNLAARVAEYLGDAQLKTGIGGLRNELKIFWPTIGAAWEKGIKKSAPR